MILRGELELRFKIPHKVIIKNHKKSKPRETEKHYLVRLTIGGKQTSGSSPGGKDQKDLEGSLKVFSQDGHGVMFFFLVVKFHIHVEAATLCATGGVHTLTCCSHTFCAQRAHCVLRTSSCVSHTHCSRSWKRCLLHAHVVSLDFSHLSPVSVRCFCTVTSRPTSPTHPSARGRAVWLLGHWARRVRQDHFRGCWHAAHQRSGPKYLWLLEDHKREHWTQCFESSVLHVSHWWFCSSERKQRKHASGNRCKAEKERKEKVLWPALQSRCQGKVDGTVLGVILFRLKGDERDLREHLERRAQKAFLGENSVQRKLYSTEYDMEIQNLERRNSEYALFESQRELESQRLQLLEDNQWTDQAQRERIHLSSELKMKNRLHQECYAKKLPRIWRIEKTLLSRGKYWKTAKIGRFLRSLIRNHAQRVDWEIKYEDYQNYWYILKTQKSSTILTHRAVMTVLAFLIKLSLLRVQESLAAILECCETHERRWVFLETFLSVNMLDEILMNYTMIQEIWRQHQRFWEQKELRKVEAKNHCNRYLYLAFRKSKTKSLDGGKCPVSMTNYTVGIGTCTQRHGNSELSLLGDASAKISWPNEIFRTGSWICEQKFAQRRRISRSSVWSWQKERCNILTPSGRLKNVFSGRQLGLVQEETLNSFPHTHATGLRETVWKEVGDARKAHLEQASSSVPKVKWQTDVKKIKV